MLYSGEQEFPKAVAALKNQMYKNWEYKVFSYLPNLEAHQALYQCVVDSSDRFDIFIKLDADMVFEGPNALDVIVEQFQQDPELDHGVFSVFDWSSQQLLMGLHVYSRRVTWESGDDWLFVDPNPVMPGRRKFFWRSPGPVAGHMPDPSLQQSYVFGYHRALKIVQRGRFRRRSQRANTQLTLLRKTWRAYEQLGDIRRIAVLCGAEDVFLDRVRIMYDKSRTSKEVESRVSDLQRVNQDDLYLYYRRRWKGTSAVYLWRRLRWGSVWRLVGSLACDCLMKIRYPG